MSTARNRLLLRLHYKQVLLWGAACATRHTKQQSVGGNTLNTHSPLTPSHFLIGCPAGLYLDRWTAEEQVSCPQLLVMSTRQQERLNHFWQCWSLQYLISLPCTVRKFCSQGRLAVGSLVLVHEDKVPHLGWPLGVIMELIPGKDGLCSKVKLRTSNGTLRRLIHQLHDLEVSHFPLNPGDNSSSVAVHNTDLLDINKFSYLKSLLHGEVA